MKKAVISVFVVLAMVLNIFGFGVLESRSLAMAEAVGSVLLSALAGFLSGVAAGLSGEVAARVPDAVLNAINSKAIANGDVIQITESGGNEYFVPVSGLDSDVSEFASFFCDYLNNRSNRDIIISGFKSENGGLHGQINVAGSVYEAAKTEAVNAFTAYLELKKHQVDIQNYSDAMDDLAAALGCEWDPSYSFSFVGPLTPVQLSDINSIHSLDYEGVHFYAPARIDFLSENGWYSEAFCKSLNLISLQHKDNNTAYAGFCHTVDMYGGGCFIIYDNDVYFNCYYNHSSNYNASKDMFVDRLSEANNGYYYKLFRNVDDVSLYDAGLTTKSSFIGLLMGCYSWTVPGSNKYPTDNNDLAENDFIDISSGGTLNPGKTDDESTIGSAISLGLISDDPTLEFDDQGNIISADGISLATLENLVQELIDKTYSFESFEEYLQTITQLLQAGNVNTDQIDDVLNALRSWEASQSDALDTLNENVATIADALTATYEVEDDHEEMDIYNVEHGGLSEAVTIVDQSMPFVQQMKNLILNIFDSNHFNNSVPNFHFYADFDHDGNNERYNAFDLSFMETTLTNENLEDKERYTQPVAISGFISYIDRLST